MSLQLGITSAYDSLTSKTVSRSSTYKIGRFVQKKSSHTKRAKWIKGTKEKSEVNVKVNKRLQSIAVYQSFSYQNRVQATIFLGWLHLLKHITLSVTLINAIEQHTDKHEVFLIVRYVCIYSMYVLFSIPDGSFKRFESNTVKLSAKETKIMDFIRGQDTPYFSRDWFGPVKLPGLSRNGSQVSPKICYM